MTSIPTNKLEDYIKDETFIRKQFQVVKGSIRLNMCFLKISFTNHVISVQFTQSTAYW